MVESILSLVNRCIVEVILLIGSVGLAVALFSLGLLMWQMRQLERTQQIIPYDQSESRRDLQQKFQGICAEWRHASMRQIALKSFQEVFLKHRATKTKDNKDVELSMPSAGDLREMSLQSELSGRASSSLNTIVSFLLILGIFGTMSGVHVALRDLGLDDIQNMRPALRPSMVAIVFTVVLMVLRALYAALLDYYLIRLDEWTTRFKKWWAFEEPNSTQGLLSRAVDSLDRLEGDMSGALSEMSKWRTEPLFSGKLLARICSLEDEVHKVKGRAPDDEDVAAVRALLQQGSDLLNQFKEKKA